MKVKSVAKSIVLSAGISFAYGANAMFMDVLTVTGGTTGGFTGQIGGISVSGSLAGNDPLTQIFDTDDGTTTFARTTLDGSSLQYTNGSIYSPTSSTGDKVGYAFFSDFGDPDRGLITETLSISFSSAVVNPVFHVANLDSMMYNFAPMGLSLTDLVLLSGNGGPDGDGLVLDAVGPIIKDAMPLTIVGVDENDPVPTNGTPRSAYGSVMLLGTFTSLTIELLQNPDTTGGDGGSFQISLAPTAVSESATLSLFAICLAGLGIAARCRKSRWNGY